MLLRVPVDMSGHKRVSFGSENVVMETWWDDRGPVKRPDDGDVREIIDTFWDDATPSSRDSLITKQIPANYKSTNRHVTIGESTVVSETPGNTQEATYNKRNNIYQHDIVAVPKTNTSQVHTDNSAHCNIQVHELHSQRLSSKKTGSTTVRDPRGYYNSLCVEATEKSQARLEAVPLMHGLDYRESHEQGSPDHPDAGYLVDNCTGWPLTRTDSLESRDNPFLPGGELSRETEDLLSRATIVRDNFFLNENEKQALRDQQQQLQHQQQMSGVKHGSTHEKPWDHVHSSSTRGYSLSQPGSNEITEESTQVHASQSPLLAVASNSSTNGGNINQPQPQENGKIGDNGTSPDVVLISVPDDDNQSALGQSGTTGDADRIFLTADLHDSDKKYGKKCCNMM